MSGQRLVRLTLIITAVVVLSLASTLTAANVVPPSNAGVSSLPFLTECSFPIDVAFSPKSINSRNVHDAITVTVSFPDGLPPEYTGVDASSVAMRLPGGTVSVPPQPGGTPNVFVFTRDDIISLVGSLRGNVDIEVSGLVGACRFVAQETIKINGPA